jgi:hypothetical protein
MLLDDAVADTDTDKEMDTEFGPKSDSFISECMVRRYIHSLSDYHSLTRNLSHSIRVASFTLGLTTTP